MKAINFTFSFRVSFVAFCVSTAMTMKLFALEYPGLVDGVVTLTEAGTYSGEFPSGMAKLVVDIDASEQVSVGGSNEGYVGTTEIVSGTLVATDQYALGGGDATVSVCNGSRLELDFQQPQGVGETTIIWQPKTIVGGDGPNGIGAFKVSFRGGKNCDNGIRSLELSDNATVDLSSSGRRWGVKNLNLNGHTLTRVNEGVDFVMKSNTITPGHFVNNAGVLLFQNSSFSECDAENTSFTVNGGSLRAWNNPSNKKIPGPIYLTGGALDFQVSTSASYFSAPVTFSSGSGVTSVDNGDGRKKVAHFQGGLVNASAENNFTLTTYGTNYVSSLLSLTGSKGFDFNAGVSFVTGSVSVAGGLNALGGKVVFKGDFDRTIEGGVNVAKGGLWCQMEGRTDTAMLRINKDSVGSGTFRLSGGSFSTRTDYPVCGETSNALGVFVQEGGQFVCSNTFTLAKKSGGFGMIVQKGGVFELRRPESDSRCISVGASGDGRYYHLGGTNISRTASYDNAEPRTYLGSTNGFGHVVVSGTGTVYATGRLVAGNKRVPSTNVVAVVNGGVLKASRLIGSADSVAPGTVSTLIVDGGTISPSFSAGFSGKDYSANDTASFFSRNFTYAIAGERGVTIDTSECFKQDGTGYPCLFPHVFSAPSGRGIASITLPDSVKSLKYKGPVPILIEGNGYGATAFADFDYETMNITTAVVLTAGCDYDESTKVYVLEAKNTSAPVRHECSFSLSSATRTAGPFTKRGAQTLRLYGVQAWGGETTIESGELKAVDKGSVPDDLKLTVFKGATLNLNTNNLSVTALAGAGTITAEWDSRGNVTLASGGVIEVAASDAVSGNAIALVKGMLTIAGPVTINVKDPDSQMSRSKKFAILSAADGIALAEGASITLDPASDLEGEWKILRKAGNLVLSPVKGLALSFR